MSAARIALTLALALCASCGPIADLRERIEPDISPPTFLGLRTLGPEEVVLSFDEPAFCTAADIRSDPPLELLSVSAEGLELRLRLAAQEPGRLYHLEIEVADQKGNSLHFITAFYGFNPRLPRLLINEFTTRGTGNHPDVVELKALQAGNMGGVVLYEGTPGNFDERLVFPAFEVLAGDFLLVHFKPQGLPEEIDETEARDLSGGLDASDGAWDFWLPQGTGISGNNGVISLYGRPGGEILDGVLYSDRSSDADELYRGFGTRDTLERAEELVAAGGWRFAGEQVRPEDAVNPDGSTGTRSICRDSASTDTDSRADWHIVPTLGFSFGAENSEEVYAP